MRKTVSTDAGKPWEPDFVLPAGHKPPRKSAMFLQAALLAYVGYLAWTGWVTVAMIDFTQGMRDGTYVSQAGLFDNREPVEELARFARNTEVAALALCLIPYLVFVHTAARNLDRAGARGFRFPPDTAFLVTFIPLANAYLIFKVMRDIWVCSHDPSRGVARPSNLLLFWWMTFLAGFAGTATLNTLSRNATADQNINQGIAYSWATLGAAALTAMSCFLLVLIVRDITRAQSRWREAPPSTPPASMPGSDRTAGATG